MWDRFDDASDDVTKERIALLDREREYKAALATHGLRVPKYVEPAPIPDQKPGVSWMNDSLDEERREVAHLRAYVERLRKMLEMIK